MRGTLDKCLTPVRRCSRGGSLSFRQYSFRGFRTRPVLPSTLKLCACPSQQDCAFEQSWRSLNRRAASSPLEKNFCRAISNTSMVGVSVLMDFLPCDLAPHAVVCVQPSDASHGSIQCALALTPS
jgi:hypothetical protein